MNWQILFNRRSLCCCVVVVVYYWISAEVVVRLLSEWRQFFRGCFGVKLCGYQLFKVLGYCWILMVYILVVVVVVALLRWLAMLRPLVYIEWVKPVIIIALSCLASIIGSLRWLTILYLIHCQSINYIL
jgi:hypothetical protein